MDAGRAAGALVVAGVAPRGRSRAGSSRRSAGPRCGAGWMPTPFGPWRYRSWLFPRDPAFAERAGPVLDLYAAAWQGRPLGPHDYVISRRREDQHSSPPRAAIRRPSRPAGRCASNTNTSGAAPGRIWRRGMSIARGLFGRCEPRPASPPFDRLVDAGHDARNRIVRPGASSGSSTTAPRIAAPTAIARLQARWPQAASRCTRPCTPVGSTRSRSTSRSCNARS